MGRDIERMKQRDEKERERSDFTDNSISIIQNLCQSKHSTDWVRPCPSNYEVKYKNTIRYNTQYHSYHAYKNTHTLKKNKGKEKKYIHYINFKVSSGFLVGNTFQVKYMFLKQISIFSIFFNSTICL